MKFIIIIPARFSSSRFPGKLLSNIQGKPMIVRMVEIALTTDATCVIVATDHIEIKRAVESEINFNENKVKVCLTGSVHQSGTERLAEASKLYGFSDNQVIVHLQGDEPLVSSNMINQVVKVLYIKHTNIHVSTLASTISSYPELEDSNIVKVVRNIDSNALYFSRSKIPWSATYNHVNPTNNMWLRHIGIYSYRADFLRRYTSWKKSPLEEFEMLEQLRVLWYGGIIHVSVIDSVIPIISVNTPEELNLVNNLFHKKTKYIEL